MSDLSRPFNGLFSRVKRPLLHIRTSRLVLKRRRQSPDDKVRVPVSHCREAISEVDDIREAACEVGDISDNR